MKSKNKIDQQVCRKCGCMDNTPCFDKVTGTCWWVEEDLCSACATPAQIQNALNQMKKLSAQQ